MNGIRIRGTGAAVPAGIVTNADLTKQVDTSEEWIRSRTGIERRHRLGEGESISELTLRAAREALNSAGVPPEAIGVVIVATFTPDTLVPSEAALLQRQLGLPHDTLCFDLNAACTGFLFALHTAECLLNSSERKYALVLGAENLSRVTDPRDRSTCILFGDAAAGVVVECREGWPSICARLGCHGSDQLLRVPGIETDRPSHVFMAGPSVFKFAVQAVPYCVDQVLSAARQTVANVDFFVFHQANARIIDLVVRKYRIPPEKYCKNIAEYGNTSSASIPLLLAQLQREGRVSSGSRVLLVGFGGGLTWGGALVEFA